jgi:8-oxo-dGTP pyrophosphatase MutT (NUDIX family)
MNNVKRNSVWTLVVSGNDLLLGRRSPTCSSSGLYNFFGGKIEAHDEDMQSCAFRELSEETNIIVEKENIKYLCNINNCYYFIVEVNKYIKKELTNEIDAYLWVNYKSINDVSGVRNLLHKKTKYLFDRDLDFIISGFKND